VATWSGTVYVVFVLDAHSRGILGWRASTSMSIEPVLDALEQAIWTRSRRRRCSTATTTVADVTDPQQLRRRGGCPDGVG
jgi:transposase InsO family protein